MTFVACDKKLSRAEQATREFEAATTIDEVVEIHKKYEDLHREDFSAEQLKRIDNARKRREGRPVD